MSAPRRSRPLRLRYRVEVRVYDGRDHHPAEVIDLSEEGVFLAMDPPIPIGTGVSFSMPLPGQRLAVRGHVQWTRSLPAGSGAPVGSGVALYDPDGSLAVAVARAIDRIRRGRQ
ncbi:MAG TPA: hypothetical protein ENK18_04365 [Deltaproteobacteria bacterium]|nr:hypothetical protein [Deltaproteobacteria bacterium]